MGEPEERGEVSRRPQAAIEVAAALAAPDQAFEDRPLELVLVLGAQRRSLVQSTG